uniref:RRM domain-containing protein n=1 Tax=Macrostomum lignano TaxID=282301 RepID=A0A1I8JA18_9PLAT
MQNLGPQLGAIGGSLSSTCLCVKGLSPDSSDLTIRQLMTQEAGVPDHAIVYSQAILDKTTGHCRGLGFVEFQNESQANQALEAIQRRPVQGDRRLQIGFALENEKDLTSVYLWNLPVSCSDYWIRQVLVNSLIMNRKITQPIKSVKALPANPKYSIGFIRFGEESDAAAAIEFFIRNGLEFSYRFGCSDRLAARLADKASPRARLDQIARLSANQRGSMNDGRSMSFEDIVKPNPVLSEISAEPLQLKDAESPFKWNAHEGSLRTPEDVIRKLSEKLKLEPMLSAAYGGLLAAYHSAASPSRKLIDFSKARKHLKDAIEAANSAHQHHVRCDFVLEAISLHLDQQQKKTSPEFDERVKALGQAWNVPDNAQRIEVRANAFHVKALALFNQGIEKYVQAEEAVRTSLSLRPDNFMCVYLLAYILARLRRYRKNRAAAGPEELLLWKRSEELANLQNLDDAPKEIRLYYQQFLINYSEALLNNADLKEKCQSLASETFLALKNLNAEDLECHYRIALKCEKLFFSLAKLMENESDYEEYESLLVRAQQVAPEPGHIWVDVCLQEYREERPNDFTHEFILDEFDTRIAKYKDNVRNKSAIQYAKGAYMCRRQLVDSGFESMVEAVQSENPRKNSLLSSALLKRAESRDEAEKRDLIVEALRLGNPEACKPAQHLLDNRRDHQRRFPLEAIKQKYCPEHPDRPVQIVPWLFSKDSYELLALISIASQEDYENYTETSPLVQTDLQKSRLALERVEQLGKQTENDYYNAIMETLKLAKSAMDGLTAKLDGYEMEKKLDYFPYGFRYMTVKKDETKKLICGLQKQSHENRRTEINKKLSNLLKLKASATDEANQRVNALVDLLSTRESKAFQFQQPFAWLVIWQELRNKAEHSSAQKPMKTLIPELLEAWNCDPDCAGSVAHMAAEFAEETRLIFEAETEALRAATGKTGVPVEDLNSAQSRPTKKFLALHLSD